MMSQRCAWESKEKVARFEEFKNRLIVDRVEERRYVVIEGVIETIGLEVEDVFDYANLGFRATWHGCEEEREEEREEKEEVLEKW